MATASHPEFSAESVGQALEAARQHAQESAPSAQATHESALQPSALKIAAQCIKVTVNNGKICLKLPFKIGSVCLPIPRSIPNGTAAEACLHICTVLGIPCGVEVSVSVGGHRIVSQHFGCSC